MGTERRAAGSGSLVPTTTRASPSASGRSTLMRSKVRASRAPCTKVSTRCCTSIERIMATVMVCSASEKRRRSWMSSKRRALVRATAACSANASITLVSDGVSGSRDCEKKHTTPTASFATRSGGSSALTMPDSTRAAGMVGRRSRPRARRDPRRSWRVPRRPPLPPAPAPASAPAAARRDRRGPTPPRIAPGRPPPSTAGRPGRGRG